MKLSIFTDGGARGNPGPAAAAFVVYEVVPSISSGSSVSPAEKLRVKRGKYLGVATNNEAEYQAVIEALEWLAQVNRVEQVGHVEQADFFLDSNLVVNQLNGLFKIKEPRLREFLVQIRQLEGQTLPIKINYSYVPRAQNFEADALVNRTLDEGE